MRHCQRRNIAICPPMARSRAFDVSPMPSNSRNVRLKATRSSASLKYPLNEVRVSAVR
jgi:hypothetical protein